MPNCTYSFSGAEGKASWSFDSAALLIQPEGAPPLPLTLGEVCGLSGDGYRLDFKIGQEHLSLQKLGADGQTLSEQLWRLWPPLRAEALRLSGAGKPERFVGKVDLGAGAVRCAVLLYGEALLFFPEEADAHPLFLSLLRSVQYREEEFTLTLTGPEGNMVRFSHFGGTMDRFAEAVRAARGALATEASTLLALTLPGLGAAARATLAGEWLPGHLRPLSELNALVPGLRQSLEASWIRVCPRAKEYAALCEGVSEENLFLAHLPPRLQEQGGTRDAEEVTPVSLPPGDESSAEADPEYSSSSGVTPEAPAPLWLLVKRPHGWALESLGEADRATYRFSGNDRIVGFCSQLLCTPQFSREALYQPLEKLVGEKSPFAIPARELAFLQELRGRFDGRVMHQGFETWRKGIR